MYDAPDENGNSAQMVLVESAQSVANRLESVCWDDTTASLSPPVVGMPYVSVALWDRGDATNSLLEAHRRNSPYIMSDDDFAQRFRSEAKLPARNEQASVFNRATLAKAAFKYDPGSVLHGVFSRETGWSRPPATMSVRVHRSAAVERCRQWRGQERPSCSCSIVSP